MLMQWVMIEHTFTGLNFCDAVVGTRSVLEVRVFLRVNGSRAGMGLQMYEYITMG